VFSHCKTVHTDPHSRWYGTEDIGVLNASGDKVLFYSMLWFDGIPNGLKFVGPQPARRLFGKLPLTTEGTRKMIKRLTTRVGPLECQDEIDQDEIRTMVLRDVANAPAAEKRLFLEKAFEPFLSA